MFWIHSDRNLHQKRRYTVFLKKSTHGSNLVFIELNDSSWGLGGKSSEPQWSISQISNWQPAGAELEGLWKLVGWFIPVPNSKCRFSAHPGRYLAALVVERIPCQVEPVKPGLRLHFLMLCLGKAVGSSLCVGSSSSAAPAVAAKSIQQSQVWSDNQQIKQCRKSLLKWQRPLRLKEAQVLLRSSRLLNFFFYIDSFSWMPFRILLLVFP